MHSTGKVFNNRRLELAHLFIFNLFAIWPIRFMTVQTFFLLTACIWRHPLERRKCRIQQLFQRWFQRHSTEWFSVREPLSVGPLSMCLSHSIYHWLRSVRRCYHSTLQSRYYFHCFSHLTWLIQYCRRKMISHEYYIKLLKCYTHFPNGILHKSALITMWLQYFTIGCD